jgi:hypothetical protein
MCSVLGELSYGPLAEAGAATRLISEIPAPAAHPTSVRPSGDSVELAAEKFCAEPAQEQSFLRIAKQLLSPRGEAAIDQLILFAFTIAGVHVETRPDVVPAPALTIGFKDAADTRIVGSQRIHHALGEGSLRATVFEIGDRNPHPIGGKAKLRHFMQQMNEEAKLFAQARRLEEEGPLIAPSRAQS